VIAINVRHAAKRRLSAHMAGHPAQYDCVSTQRIATSGARLAMPPDNFARCLQQYH
jgi:hypothetical protein